MYKDINEEIAKDLNILIEQSKQKAVEKILRRLADRIASGIPITLEFIFNLAEEYEVEL